MCGLLCRADRQRVLCIHQQNLDRTVGGAHTPGSSPCVLLSSVPPPPALLCSTSAHPASLSRPQCIPGSLGLFFPQIRLPAWLSDGAVARGPVWLPCSPVTALKFFMLLKQVAYIFILHRLCGQPFPEGAMGSGFEPPIWGPQCPISPWVPGMPGKSPSAMAFGPVPPRPPCWADRASGAQYCLAEWDWIRATDTH